MKKLLAISLALILALGMVSIAAAEDVITIGFAQVGHESDWRAANTLDYQNTFTAENGYAITSVDCNVAAKIDTKTWTVTIPAGLENVVIDVDTDPDVYTVTYDETSEWWSGRHMIKTSGETTIERDGSITVELTTDFIGATNAQVKVTGATGEFTKVNGVDQKTDSTTISTEAELKVLQNQFGTIYSDAACENPVAGAVTPSMTVYWITVEGQAAVWTGTISNPTGDVTVEFVWKG